MDLQIQVVRRRNNRAQKAYQARKKEQQRQTEERVAELQQQLSDLRLEAARIKCHSQSLEQRLLMKDQLLQTAQQRHQVFDWGPPIPAPQWEAHLFPGAELLCNMPLDQLMQYVRPLTDVRSVLQVFDDIRTNMQQLILLHDNPHSSSKLRAQVVQCMQMQHVSMMHHVLAASQRDPIMIKHVLLHMHHPEPPGGVPVATLLDELQPFVEGLQFTPAEVNHLMALRSTFSEQYTTLLQQRRQLVYQIHSATAYPSSSVSGSERPAAQQMVTLHHLIPQLQANLVREHVTLLQFCTQMMNTVWARHFLPAARLMTRSGRVFCDLRFLFAVGLVHARLDVSGKPVACIEYRPARDEYEDIDDLLATLTDDDIDTWLRELPPSPLLACPSSPLLSHQCFVHDTYFAGS